MTRVTLARRWVEHKCAAKGGTKTALYAAIRLHGVENFEIFEIAQLLPGLDRKALGEVEKAVIAQEGTLSPAGYNLTRGGDGLLAGVDNPNLGRKVTPEHAAKVAASWTPEKRKFFSDLRAKRNREMNQSAEHKAKLKAAWDRSPERRVKTAETAKKVLGDFVRLPENRARSAEQMRALHARSEVSVRCVESQRTPEYRDMCSARAKQQWVERRQANGQ